jgi:BTB/POZ domain
MRQNHAARRAPRHPRPAHAGPPLKAKNGGGKRTDKACCSCELVIKKSKGIVAFEMQQSGRFTDVLLRTADNAVTPAHKWILASLSPRLLPAANMLVSSGAAASPPPTVDLDLTSHVLGHVLELAYTGTCRLAEEWLSPLLEAATAYQIRPLLKLCGDYILEAAATRSPGTPAPAAAASITVRHFRLAQQHLCHHVVERLARTIRRQFPDHMGPDGAGFLFTPQELALLVAKSDLPLRETTLIEFLLAAAAAGSWDLADTRCLLQYVRFTLLSRDELEQLMADDRVAPFLAGRPHAVVPLCRMLQAQGLLPPADSRLRQRTVVLPQEEHRIPRQVVAVLGGWAASPPGPTNHVETYNHVTNRWKTLDLKLPAKRAYHGLILRRNQVISKGPIIKYSMNCYNL